MRGNKSTTLPSQQFQNLEKAIPNSTRPARSNEDGNAANRRIKKKGNERLVDREPLWVTQLRSRAQTRASQKTYATPKRNAKNAKKRKTPQDKKVWEYSSWSKRKRDDHNNERQTMRTANIDERGNEGSTRKRRWETYDRQPTTTMSTRRYLYEQ